MAVRDAGPHAERARSPPNFTNLSPDLHTVTLHDLAADDPLGAAEDSEGAVLGARRAPPAAGAGADHGGGRPALRREIAQGLRSRGFDPERAAEELVERLDVSALAERDAVVRSLWPDLPAADRGRLDLAFSRLKLDLRVSPEDVAADDAAGPVARAWVAYERALRDDGALDFDDFVLRALRFLEGDDGARSRWRVRCRQLLVDEAQDLDRTQLDLALLLAAPANRVFLVGDDDQTVYGWRLAEVNRLAHRIRMGHGCASSNGGMPRRSQ